MPPDPAPIPILAQWNGVLKMCVVTFDLPLVAGGLDIGNWFVRFGGLSWALTNGAAGGSQVNLQGSGGSVPDAGPDVVGYSPPPFDVLASVGAVPAAGFADFPLT